jgi:hypothetical protein
VTSEGKDGGPGAVFVFLIDKNVQVSFNSGERGEKARGQAWGRKRGVGGGKRFYH